MSRSSSRSSRERYTATLTLRATVPTRNAESAAMSLVGVSTRGFATATTTNSARTAIPQIHTSLAGAARAAHMIGSAIITMRGLSSPPSRQMLNVRAAPANRTETSANVTRQGCRETLPTKTSAQTATDKVSAPMA